MPVRLPDWQAPLDWAQEVGDDLHPELRSSTTSPCAIHGWCVTHEDGVPVAQPCMFVLNPPREGNAAEAWAALVDFLAD